MGLALGGATASKKSAGRCRTAFKLVQSHPASIRISSASQSTCVGQRMAGNWARSMGSLPRTTLASLQSSPIASYGPMGRRGPPASKCRTTPSALMRGLTPGCCLSARECREMETHLIQGHLSLSVDPGTPLSVCLTSPHTRATACTTVGYVGYTRALGRLCAGASVLCKYSCIVFTLYIRVFTAPLFQIRVFCKPYVTLITAEF